MCQTMEVSVTHIRATKALQPMRICARVAASVHLSGGVLFQKKRTICLFIRRFFVYLRCINKLYGITRVLASVTQNNLWSQWTSSLFGLGKRPMKTFSPGSTYANISNRHVRSPWRLTRQVHTSRFTIFWSGGCQLMTVTHVTHSMFSINQPK